MLTTRSVQKNRKNNNRKNRTVKKNRLKFWKNRPVRFFKPGTRKTKSNPNRKKPEKNRAKTELNRKNRANPEKNQAKTEKTEPNRFEPVFALKNQTKTGRFEPVSVFLKKKFSLVTSFDKNWTEPKMNTPTNNSDMWYFYK